MVRKGALPKWPLTDSDVRTLGGGGVGSGSEAGI